MTGAITLLVFVPFIVVVLLANVGERKPWARWTTYGSFVLIDLAALGLAALSLLVQAAAIVNRSAFPQQILEVHWWLIAVACLTTVFLASVVPIPDVRRWLARRLPIDPDSLVHTTALAFVVYWIGGNLGQMALVGDLDILVEAGTSLSIWDLVFSGIPQVLLALAGIGLVLRRTGRQALERLGLRIPTWKHVLFGLVVTGLLLALNYGVGLAWQALDPTGSAQAERVSDALFGGLTGVGSAIAVGLIAGISEELLFRGALQPRLGLLLTAVAFSLGHVQYGFTPATLEVLAAGLVLGFVRNRSSTTLCILIHAVYNTCAMLMSS